MTQDNSEFTGLEIAVIGMAGRFPGAGNIHDFWENLKKGVESICFFSERELEEEGAVPHSAAAPNYIKANAMLDRIEYFDSNFFGYSPGEASIMDPQQRIFHECAWSALEDAGYCPDNCEGLTGLYAGATTSSAWENRVRLSGKTEDFGQFAAFQLANRDFLSLRISYKLNLKGPAVNVQTTCSTSLTAIHMACQAILNGECDMALAGGVSVSLLKKEGYVYREGMILSPDGHCRAFDAKAKGTVGGNGAGIVVLKRLEEAVAQGDYIYAVVKGSAVNNDGIRKVGFTAPSVEGQAEVIAAAQEMAEVEPESIAYVETHGTGTELGDPVETQALKLAFAPAGDSPPSKKNSCALGSVKTNFGHLDAAAGVTGFIKTVLALYHRMIPPSLHFENPNPKIDLKNSPFYINTRLIPWEKGNYPRRAGVSSFGIGGTNAHVILEEAPEGQRVSGPKGRCGSQLLLISARSDTALENASENLLNHLKQNPHINVADAAYTLQVGRKAFKHRQMILCPTPVSVNHAVDILSSGDPETLRTHMIKNENRNPQVIFMFPGQGSQYVNMGSELYREEPVFREAMDCCFEILKGLVAYDIKEILYPSSGSPVSPAAKNTDQTEVAQPLLFAVEYALAKLLMQWGITPYAMIGHSIGEYTAACLSGVFSLEDALEIVVLRGRLMQQMPTGAMLGVPLSEEELIPLLESNKELSLAAVNSSSLCTVSGSPEAIDTFAGQLDRKGYRFRRLHTSHAFHSHMMDPLLEEFEEKIREIPPHSPGIRFISNSTGTWISGEEARSPHYWSSHLRETVRFAQGLDLLLKEDTPLFVEVGPGNMLSTFVRKHKAKTPEHMVVNLIPHPRETISHRDFLLTQIGKLWLYDVPIDWQEFQAGEKRYRIPLPAYPFEPFRYPIPKELPLTGAGRVSQKFPGERDREDDTAGGTAIGVEQETLVHPRPDLGTKYIEPQSEPEQTLAQIFRDFLGIHRVGIYDDFFELGGDSLKVMGISSKIHKQLNVEIPLTEFFRRPTIKKLAQYIDTAGKHSFSAIKPVETKEYYPLSSAQKRLYVLQQMEKDFIGYNETLDVVLEGKLDKEKFEKTFQKLIKRHESLRTSFHMVEDVPVQRVHRENYKLQITNYKQITYDKLQIAGIVKGFIRPFEFTQAPLMRVGLIETAANRHILLIDMHHIITDGTSVNIFLKELMYIYNGEGSLLPVISVTYKDFAQWQNKKKAPGEQEEYWLKEFGGEIPVLHLPVDFPRPVIQDFAGRALTFEIGKKETEKLKALALNEGATLYMVLLSFFYILLTKISGQEEILVGSPTAGRRHSDLENIIGMFVNTLALRNYPTGKKTVNEFLREVKDKILKAQENQDYPFEDLVEKISPETKRDTGRNPLFDVMFVLQNMTVSQIEVTGLKLIPYNYESRISKFDLTLICRENSLEKETGIHFSIEYSTKLFKKETIERFVRYYKYIISSVPDTPSIKIEEIEIATEEEKRQILYNFNDTSREYPSNRCIHELFEQQVEKGPDNVALIGHGVSLTYRELNKKSGQLARLLIKKGVQPGIIVGIMVERSIEMITGILGILKAGGAYLPIDPGYPQERIDYMLADSGTDILLKKSEIRNGRNLSDRNKNLSSSELAYIIYTSGTTGKPKGTLIGHRSLVNLCTWHNRYFAVTERDNAAQYASFGFDASVWELFPYLVKGASIHIIADEIKLDIRELAGFFNRQQITAGFLPTQFCQQFMEEVTDCSSLRLLLTGGDKLNRFIQRNYRLYNNYGPTENTVVSTVFLVDNDYGNIPIGRPIDNTKIYILNKFMQLQPLGIVGEICVGGDGLARGYLNQPELTNEKFCLRRAGVKIMYHTGDLGRWLPDGNIQFAGRIDHQLKIRGYRIEPAEIERRLECYGGIEKAVVTVQTGEDGDKRLCAYIVSGTTISEIELRSYLSAHLPEYMVPLYFIRLEQLPLTPGGKLDKGALPVPGFEPAEDYIAPGNDVEEKLVEIWSEILGIAKDIISINGNFFRLGGHSLKATVLISKIHKQFKVKIPLAEVFKRPSIRGISSYINAAGEDEYRWVEAAENREYYPLSASQKRMFILNQFIEYNVPLVMVIEGSLDEKRFEKVFREMIKRHESLRTSFEMVAGEPVQRIRRYEDTAFELSGCDGRGSHMLDSVRAEIFQPFDLAKAPLMRVGLIKLAAAEEKYLFLFNLHHLVIDGTAMGILVRECLAIYEGNRLPPLSLRYKDFSQWENRFFKTAAYKKQENYWLRVFSGEIPVMNMPLDYPRPAVQHFEGDLFTFELTGNDLEALNAWLIKEKVSLFMILTAVFNILLFKYTGQEDIVIGTIVAGRDSAEVENLIGIFINTLALRNFPSANKTFKEFLKEVKDVTLKAFQNQRYPFGELLENVEVKKDLTRTPLFDVMLVLQNMDMPGVETEDLRLRPYNPGEFANLSGPGTHRPDFPVHAQHDMTLWVTEQEGILRFSLEYCTKLFKRETMERFAGHFLNILKKMHRDSSGETRLSHIEIMGEEEKRHILYDFNDTAAEYPGEKTIRALFEEQVEKNPDVIAVVDEAAQGLATYRELNKNSNRLAHRLKAKGIGSDRIVGIMPERSVAMLTAVTAVLKAGGAFLPLDANYPANRIAYMLENSNAQLLLTQGKCKHSVTFAGEIIDMDNPSLYRGDAGNPQGIEKASDLAYVIYTSGSTGRPKGVMVQHGNYVNAGIAWCREYKLQEIEVHLLQMAGFSFDVFAGDFARVFINGGRMVICPENIRVDPPSLYTLIRKQRITLFESTPSLVIPFMEYVHEKKQAIDNLQLLIIGSDSCRAADFKKIVSHFGSRMRIINSYGVTEATIDSSFYEEPVENISSAGNVPIGKPMPNMKFFILDRVGNLQAVGIPGELCVGGDGVARGYLNQPELTAEKFNKTYMSHIYHTGDLACWLPEGNVEFLGRLDSQVKIRGYRIEVEEIEHRLMTHKNIKEAVVSVRDGNLRAYVVPVGEETNNFTFTVSELREYLSGELPDYMIPAHFTRMEKIPLTVNGKIDKKAVIASDAAGSIGIGTEYAAPTNEVEEKLADLWAETLAKERVGIYDNFFDLGGHSLMAMRLASLINQAFNVKVPLIAFFQVSTVKGIAGLILESRAAGDKGESTAKEDHSLAGVKFEKKKRRKMQI